MSTSANDSYSYMYVSIMSRREFSYEFWLVYINKVGSHLSILVLSIVKRCKRFLQNHWRRACTMGFIPSGTIQVSEF